MKTYNIYHVNSNVFYDGELPIARMRTKRLVLSTTDETEALKALHNYKADRNNERSHESYSVVDGKEVHTDNHDHFFYMEIV